MKTDIFLNEYRTISKDRISNQKIGRMLSEIGIKPIKNSGNKGYNYKKCKRIVYAIQRKKLDRRYN